ncbi:phage antirepressor Ant [Clostridioides difficile]|nr:phage antirepressor Ant [Clostridioides difficile]DAU66062.1 MAG TPA: KilAC domain protein [Caudoviricetes sp.]
MNELQIFKNNEFGEIRTVTKNNEPWFVATDVCSALDISNTSQALTRLDDDEKNTIILNEGIGNPNKSIVSEYGLYNLILASRKKEAKKFKRWITHDVIPTIRKHGAYMTSEVIEKTLTDPDYLIQLATNLKEEKAKRALAEAQVEKDKPKVLFADSCEVAENSILIGEFAKRLKQNGYDIGQNKLFEWLRQHDYLCKSGERKNLPTQYSMERGLFEIKTRVFSNPNGSVRTTSTTKITGRGQIYFTNKFLGV